MNHDRDAEFYGLYRSPLQPPPRKRLALPLPEGEPPLEPCAYASEFLRQMEALIFGRLEERLAKQATAGRTALIDHIARLKSIVNEEYQFFWRSQVPASHFHPFVERHFCVHDAANACWLRLHRFAWEALPSVNVLVAYERVTRPPRRRRVQEPQEPVARLYSLGVPLGELEK